MKIAHLTDLHLNGGADRHDSFLRAVTQAKDLDATHLVLTGDLTSSGRPEQFHELAWMLRSNWIGGVTIVRGNHDGPLFHLGAYFAKWARTSVPGIPVHLANGVTIVPVDTYNPRRSLVFRALGRAPAAQIYEAVRSARSGRLTVLAMHHGPSMDPLRKFAGLTNRREVAGLIGQHPNLHVLCGHEHVSRDDGNVHVADSCGFGRDPLRVYEVSGGFWSNVYPKQALRAETMTHRRAM